MAKRVVDTYLVRVLVASGGLMLMTGCHTTTTLASSTNLAMFIQQFAQEAFAAFLF